MAHANQSDAERSKVIVTESEKTKDADATDSEDAEAGEAGRVQEIVEDGTGVASPSERLGGFVEPEEETAALPEDGLITIEQVRRDPEVVALVDGANHTLHSLGYTEHGRRHAGLVGHIAENVLIHLGFPERMGQLANIAGYLHDIGNAIHRENHAMSGSLLAWEILARLGIAPHERVVIMNAIGNHEEERGLASTPVAAALIVADKADVHRSRVQNPSMPDFDIHDRVNYATTRSFVRVRPDEKVIALELEIDANYAQVMEYFEIFLDRMTMVRQSVEFLGCSFQLIINETRFS